MLYEVNDHKEALVSCGVHPINVLGVVASRDGTFSFHDFNKVFYNKNNDINSYRIRKCWLVDS